MSFTLRVTKGTIKTQAYANVLYVSVGVHEALLKSEHATTYPGLLKEGDGVLVDVKGFPFYALCVTTRAVPLAAFPCLTRTPAPVPARAQHAPMIASTWPRHSGTQPR